VAEECRECMSEQQYRLGHSMVLDIDVYGDTEIAGMEVPEDRVDTFLITQLRDEDHRNFGGKRLGLFEYQIHAVWLKSRKVPLS